MTLKKENILIVDDNYDMLELLQRNLKAQNYHTYKASSVVEAIDVLKYSTIDLLITDLQMPGINGIELIKFADEHYPMMPKLVVTGFPSVESAVTAVKSGALEYLIKPFTADELKKAVDSAFEKHPATSKKQTSEIATKGIRTYAGMVGSSSSFAKLIDTIERVKDNKATVLIHGESGTGKELIAKAIHYQGTFAANPFVAVNCGGIPENLMESELFGFTKGAFTGANETRIGLFQTANGGTIFLDEIGTAPLSVQTRLLRVLQEKEVSKVGSGTAEKIDLRVVSATNSALLEMVRKGTFREDLYYRLNVVNIETLPLRERPEDIGAIATTFIKKYGHDYGKPETTLSTKALEILQRHSWPGNVRELENIIQRMIILGDGMIDVEHLPDYLKYREPYEGETLLSLKDVEKSHILKVLASVGNNKTKAAEILEIDRKTLRQKLN